LFLQRLLVILELNLKLSYKINLFDNNYFNVDKYIQKYLKLLKYYFFIINKKTNDNL